MPKIPDTVLKRKGRDRMSAAICNVACDVLHVAYGRQGDHVVDARHVVSSHIILAVSRKQVSSTYSHSQGGGFNLRWMVRLLFEALTKAVDMCSQHTCHAEGVVWQP